MVNSAARELLRISSAMCCAAILHSSDSQKRVRCIEDHYGADFCEFLQVKLRVARRVIILKSQLDGHFL